MKTVIVSILGLLTAASAMANQPSLYNCQSHDGKVKLGYTTSSIMGKPTFSLRINGKDVLSGEGVEAVLDSRDATTSLGQFVSVIVNRKYVADAPSQVYSVLIPGIELGSGDTVKFETILLDGSTGGFMALPAVYQRVNKVIELKCEAKHVLF